MIFKDDSQTRKLRDVNVLDEIPILEAPFCVRLLDAYLRALVALARIPLNPFYEALLGATEEQREEFLCGRPRLEPQQLHVPFPSAVWTHGRGAPLPLQRESFLWAPW